MEDTTVDRLARSALEAKGPEPGAHPEPDVLFRYHVEELSVDEHDHVQEHLSLCARCARVVLDFDAFPRLDAPRDDDLPSDAEVARGWAEVRARLDPVPLERMPEARAPAPWLKLAASALAVLSLGLAATTLWLHRQGRLPREGDALVLTALDPALGTDKGRGTDKGPGADQGHEDVAQVRAGTDTMLLLDVAEGARRESYRAILVDSTGRTTPLPHGLRRTRDGAVNLLLSAGYLRAGRYRLILEAESGAPLRLEYGFLVAP